MTMMRPLFTTCALAALLVAQGAAASDGKKPARSAPPQAPVSAPAPMVDRLTSLPVAAPAAPAYVAPAASAPVEDDVVPLFNTQNAPPPPAPKPVALPPAPLPAVVEVPVVVEAPAPKKVWVAARGKMLRETLENWATESQWELVWESDHDYVLRAGVELEGEFTDTITTLLEAYQFAQPPVEARIYPANRVIKIFTPTNLDVN